MSNVPELRFSEFASLRLSSGQATGSAQVLGEWEEKSLGEVCLKIQDGNYGAVYPKSNEFIKEGIPFLTSKAIGKSGNLIESKIDYISVQKHKLLKKAHLNIRDVLFTNRGASVGAIGFVDERISHGNIGPQLTLLRADTKIIEPLFLKEIMKSYNLRKQIRSQDSGSAMNFFGIGATSKFKLTIPKVEEQQKIATFLSAVDKKLGHLRRKHELLDSYKRGIASALFSTRMRFKRDDGTAFPDWKEKRLGGLGKFYGGGTPATSKEEYWNGNIPWVSSSDINDGCIHNISITRFINKKAIKDSATKIIPKNSILLISRVGVGKLAVSEKEVCTSQDFSNFTPDKTDVYFLAYFLVFNKNKLLSFSQGTSIKGFTSSDISALKIDLPCLEEQQKIANFLSTLDKKLEAVQKQIDQTEVFKKGLLQKMFV